MGEVAEFKLKERKELCYECQCGCQHFIVGMNYIKCTACSLISNNIEISLIEYEKKE
jgi:hypothetical protein